MTQAYADRSALPGSLSVPTPAARGLTTRTDAVPEPWIKIVVGLARSDKVAALPNDSARWGWVCVLLEAKTRRHLGAFPDRRTFLELMGRHSRYLKAFIDVGLLHVFPSGCRCEIAYRDDVEAGALVVHDYRQQQRDPTAAERKATSRARHADVTPDVTPDVTQHSRALSPSLSLSPSSYDSSSNVPSGAARDPHRVFDAVELVESLTSRSFGHTPGSKTWQTLEEDVTALGFDRVAEAYRGVAHVANGEPLDAAGVVYGGHHSLYRIPRPLSAQESKQAEHDEALRRVREGARRAERS